MDHFHYKHNALYAEQVPLLDIAEKYGTPAYVYSRATIERHFDAFYNAFVSHPHLICFAVKANSNLAVLNILARMGSGFDIVSAGELARVIQAGGDTQKVVFSGVAKQDSEIKYALQQQIKCFNVESIPELDRISRVAQQIDMTANISLRINPDVDAKTHPYISTGLKSNKFGIASEEAINSYEYAQGLPNVKVVGVDCHIGSQLTEMAPFEDALDKLLKLLDQLESRGIRIDHLDLGGGLGVTYQDESPPLPSEYAKSILNKLATRKDITLVLEPGRAIVANAGILLTRVEYLKFGDEKNFAIVDAGMNDLLRPSLYDAWQNIIPVLKPTKDSPKTYDVVGPVCETGDFLGKDRQLTLSGDELLAVRSAGAYGFVMSSNYNSRCRPAEIMVDKDEFFVVRQRETIEDLWRGEAVLPD